MFQSTRPVRGATAHRSPPLSMQARFNPRAPCGARHDPACGCAGHICFNPRAPCGARRVTMTLTIIYSMFQSTRPVRGATFFIFLHLPSAQFQSTRPVRGATAKEVTISLFCHIFMGVTRHEYDFLGAHAPRPSFSVIHVPTFLHLIFCSLHLRTLPSAHMMIAASMS